MNRTEIARQTLLGHTVAHLRDLAREAGIVGRSAMRKAELAEALIPSTLAEIAQVEANRARQASLAKATDRVAPLVGKAMEARDRYNQIAARCGQENGGPAVSIAWEDYLDACDAAGVCTHTRCWEAATDGDGRCGQHSHGAALGDDVVPSSESEAAVSRETAEPGFRLLLSSVRGDDYPGSDTFASVAEARAHVRRELTSTTSVWRVRVLDSSGEVVRIAVRSGYNASGRSWIWATPLPIQS